MKKGLTPCLAAALLLPAFIAPADARITRLQITAVESPTFGGRAFGAAGAVGTYEKLIGRAFGEVDPADPRNALITDLTLAPRNAAGKVEYSVDVYILRPADLRASNGKLFFEVSNRGNKLSGPFNGAPINNNPTTAADAGDAFLMNQGYALAWSGWDPTAAPGNNRLTIQVPVARNADGSSITGPSYEYLVFDNATTLQAGITYPANSLDTSLARLTVRQHLTDAPTVLAPGDWEFVNPTTIRLLPAGTAFRQSAIYELTYTARDPVVAGLGFAATRDVVSFLRHATADDLGNPNPLAGAVHKTLAFTISQPARYVNDFVWLGFNEDERGRRVFDGIENWIGAGDGVALNFRFAQPGRTERNRQHHLYPEGIFPFAFATAHDRLTGKTDGRARRCRESETCPKLLDVISANEYWVKAGSLVHTEPTGHDLASPGQPDAGDDEEVPFDASNVRHYLLSGLEHTVAGAAPFSSGICQQYQNPTDPNPALRALFVAMEQWVSEHRPPPPSLVPRDEDGNAVFSVPQADGLGVVPQAALGWPDIPGVTYTGLITVRHLFDWGPDFDQGILTNNPPAFAGPVYPSFVSKVDSDGNEIAGVRLPPVAVPIATTSGWALRAAAFGGPDGCESSGQWIPFAATRAARIASHDPRPSLEERYRSHDDYVERVTQAARDLEERRFLLPADVQRYIDAAAASNVLR
jgi:Alpha/beta hydrolase domain